MLGVYILPIILQVFSKLDRVITQHIVNIPNGPIRGTQKSILDPHNSTYLQGRDLTYVEYLGIPYAEPPVGNLRFRPPQPLKTNWSDVRDATKHGAACMQHQMKSFPPPAKMSEDCLYLDVLTPGGRSSSKPKAVMIWIHPSGYIMGSTQAYDGALHTVIGDVVVVMMNYRLDIFGFLSTGDNVVPGNMGLLDQQLAIRWVKENIELFGGDPKNITLFGESAGATSVTQHAVSPTNKGLFHLHFIVKTCCQPSDKLEGCTDDNVTMLIECLRWVDPEALLIASRPPFDAIDIMFGWNPVVDGTFIAKEPRDMLRSKSSGPAEKMLKSVDMLIGHNSDEGYSMLLFYALFQQSNFSLWEHSWNEMPFLLPLLRKLIRLMSTKYGDEKVAEIIQESIAYTYLGIDKGKYLNGERLAQIINDIINDEWFLIPVFQFANLHEKLGGRNFKYHFTYRPSTSKYPAWVKGADHGAEISLQFKNFPVDPVDQLVAYTLITYWSNFAKTGNPNKPSAHPALPVWPQSTSQILDISASSQPGEPIKPDRVLFWTEYLPKIAASVMCLEKKAKRKHTRNNRKNIKPGS